MPSTRICCFIVLVFANLSFAQIISEPWLSRDGAIIQYDKAEHGALFFVGQSILTGMHVSKKHSVPLLLFSGALWEAKDAILRYEKYGAFGGNGFSWKDLVADGVGISLSLALVHDRRARASKPELPRVQIEQRRLSQPHEVEASD